MLRPVICCARHQTTLGNPIAHTEPGRARKHRSQGGGEASRPGGRSPKDAKQKEARQVDPQRRNSVNKKRSEPTKTAPPPTARRIDLDIGGSGVLMQRIRNQTAGGETRTPTTKERRESPGIAPETHPACLTLPRYRQLGKWRSLARARALSEEGGRPAHRKA